MRRVFYVGVLYLLFNALYCIPAFAADWEVYPPDVREAALDRQDIDDDISFEEWQDQVASSSVASRSNAFRSSEPPSLYSSYTPYDSSISTTVIQYMSDVLPKLGNVSYVLFRSGQYTYRFVYADDLQYVNGVFSSPGADYISYDSRDYQWYSGTEGSFTLRTNGYIVYSDIGDYPVLARDSMYLYAVMFLGVIFLLFTLYRSFFNPGRVVI